MKPRAILFDLFGDYLRYAGGEAPLQALYELLDVFGVGESTARVAMSRMRKEGWFTTRRDGRATIYSLTDTAWQTLDEGRERIFNHQRDSWDGVWSMVIYGVAEPERAERERVRKTLAWLGFGSSAPATWVSPHERLNEVEKSLGDTTARLDLLTCRLRGPGADQEMANRCWDLVKLADDYTAFIDRLLELPLTESLSKLPHREALLLRVELVNSYRTFPFRDPDLPEQLLPEDWPGWRAHQMFIQLHDALNAPAEAFVRSVLARAGVATPAVP